MIKACISKLMVGESLRISEMEMVMDEIMSAKASAAQVAAFLIALRLKGESVNELLGAVKVMRRQMIKVQPFQDQKVVLDTCGTGGDCRDTFNISTVAAFISSGAGVVVAKHGNRSVSSSCGSADLLESAGVNILLDPPALCRCLSECGIAFLFAQLLHPAMKNAAAIRKDIGVRTIFNLLGPLTNPASARHQLLGVYDPRWTAVLAEVLAKMGSKHAMLVHGSDGLDEVTLTGKTLVSEYYKGKLRSYSIDPVKFGFKTVPLKRLKGGSKEANVRILLSVLNGEKGPARDVSILNAACAIYAADRAKSVKEGVELAEQSVDTGSALRKFEALRTLSHKLGTGS